MSQVYGKIVEGIINREYGESLAYGHIVDMLGIYSHHRDLAVNGSEGRLKSLRTFLFRFLADNHQNHSSWQEFGQMLQHLVDLDDSSSFDDGNGNYPLPIFEEIRPYVKDQLLEGLLTSILQSIPDDVVTLMELIAQKYYS